jgi:hypothetical protein
MKRLAFLTIAVAALAAPAGALASGVVLKVQRATHLVAVAQSNTKVALVHTGAAARLHVGQRVAVTGRTLANGTVAAARVRVVGHTHVVRFRGLLLAKDRGHMVVSAGGAAIAVDVSPDDHAPKPGTTVDVTASVGATGDLDDDDVTPVSADAPGGSIEGALTLGTGTVTIVSEHLALRIAVPVGFDLSMFRTGDEVLAVFAQQADGTLLLTRLTRDANAREADDDGNGDGGAGGGGDHHGGHGRH